MDTPAPPPLSSPLSPPARTGVVLVTGGAGFVGANLVRQTLALADSLEVKTVRVMDNLALSSGANLVALAGDPRLEVLPPERSDVRDPAHCLAATAGVDVVFHLAALPSVPRSVAHPQASYHTNVMGLVNVLGAARQNGVRRVVYASSSSVYGGAHGEPEEYVSTATPKSPYAQSKWINEETARMFYQQYGLETVGLRFFNVFGPFQPVQGAYSAVIPAFMAAAAAGRPATVFGDGGQTRAFTFVDDVARACWLAARTAHAGCFGRAVNVGNTATTSVLELLSQLGRVLDLGGPVPHQLAPERPGDVRHSAVVADHAREWLGFEARVPLAEGLARTWAWFRDEHGVEMPPKQQ